jgi:drug/metabolite transporter (DMT)-like permease
MTASYVALLIPLGIHFFNLYCNNGSNDDTTKRQQQQQQQQQQQYSTDGADTATATTATTTTTTTTSTTKTPSSLVPQLNFSEWLTFVAAVFAYTTHNLLFYKALDYTTIGNAVIYANSQALLLIIAKGLTGERIHPFEAVGVIVAFTGAILCSKDSESEHLAEAEDEEGGVGEAVATVLMGSSDGSSSSAAAASSSSSSSSTVPSIVGDMMALAAAIAGVAYLTFAKAVRPHMSVTVFMFSVLMSGSFLVLLFIVWTEGRDGLEWNMDPYVGVFGWLDLSHHRLPVILHLAVIVNMIGTMGFVRAMKYFENVVISVATLMEPLMASLIAYSFQIGSLPGPLGWTGNVLVIVGTLAVVYPSVGTGSNSGSDVH